MRRRWPRTFAGGIAVVARRYFSDHFLGTRIPLELRYYDLGTVRTYGKGVWAASNNARLATRGLSAVTRTAARYTRCAAQIASNNKIVNVLTFTSITQRLQDCNNFLTPPLCSVLPS